MKAREVCYEVFVDSIHGSDVVVKDTLNEALKCAETWSKEVKNPVIVTKVTTEVDCQYRNGQWELFKK